MFDIAYLSLFATTAFLVMVTPVVWVAAFGRGARSRNSRDVLELLLRRRPSRK